MKKRLLALMMAAMMAFALAACGSDDAGNNGQSNAPDSSSPAGEQSSEPDGTNADFKVGAIYINSKNDTAGYTYAHNNGITTAMKDLGLDVDSQLVIVDEVAEDYEAVSTAVDTLVGEGCNIIFGISFGYIDALADKAEEYPEVIFSHATGYKSNETNFNNYCGRIYQARYLAGVAAGLKSLEMGNNSIGYVAAYNREYAETCSGINGFTMGVLSVNPEATVYVKELGAWADEQNEYAFAEELINTYNCCVIAQHCDTANPQIAAQERGVWGCGYNADMTVDAPEAHLTAPVWNWGAVYTMEVQEVIDGTWKPENIFLTMADGLVDISPLSKNCAEGTAEAIEAAREKIVSGEFDVFEGPLYDNEGNQILDENSCFVADIEGTSAKAGEPITPAFIAGELMFVVKGVEIQ